MRGLKGHRQFKHGVRDSAQLPLQKHDLLVDESKLEQLLDARFAVISEQVDALSNGDKQQGERIKQLEQRLAAAESRTIDDFSPVDKAEFVIPWLAGLDDQEFFKLARGTGHDVVPDPAVVTILAETFEKQAEEETIIPGKTELPGYRYLETLNLSVKE